MNNRVLISRRVREVTGILIVVKPMVIVSGKGIAVYCLTDFQRCWPNVMFCRFSFELFVKDVGTFDLNVRHAYYFSDGKDRTKL